VNVIAYYRLFTRITKEGLWLYVLRLLTKRPIYAYEISKEIKARFGFSKVTVYVVLYKMERKGLIRVVKRKLAMIQLILDPKLYKKE
jgi:DNA-binding PadR family transcriptional regulator